MRTLVIVSVDRPSVEVSRIVLGDDGEVTYSGGDTGRGVHRQLMRVAGLDPVEAFERLAEDGWSNGYLRLKAVDED